ncbi:nucleotidyltransferase domain-containing protein, partial [Patescibacteria group bacterium]|nr:nucleotidyltransferase domain-containing protein [Patescibacteria group bacterium]
MGNRKMEGVLKQVLERIEPPKEEIKFITEYLKKFVEELKKEIKKQRIAVDIFVGGSFAKKTLIKKDDYDVDVFLRFDKKYGDKISELSKKLIGRKNETIHGSRDYFRIRINPHFLIELIPVIKVKNPKESNNITDLSYSHVKYVNSKIKKDKILDEIKIAKAFCYANNCYGAESYVRGFSGYALELLVYYYRSFAGFLKEVKKTKGKLVLDIEKNYKNKQEILMDLNSAKLQSPIVLVDPTFKHRNVTAALSEETFERFIKSASKFLKNPSIKSFEKERIDFKKEKETVKKNKRNFILMEIETNKQEGDVAGSKLLKFYKQILEEMRRFFDLKNKG